MRSFLPPTTSYHACVALWILFYVKQAGLPLAGIRRQVSKQTSGVIIVIIADKPNSTRVVIADEETSQTLLQ